VVDIAAAEQLERPAVLGLPAAAALPPPLFDWLPQAAASRASAATRLTSASGRRVLRRGSNIVALLLPAPRAPRRSRPSGAAVPRIAPGPFRSIAGSANPGWRLAGNSGFRLAGIEDGCWW